MEEKPPFCLRLLSERIPDTRPRTSGENGKNLRAPIETCYESAAVVVVDGCDSMPNLG